MTILEGSTFCICDEIGDLDGRTSGFFAEDTRFLSRLELRVNGARPLLLSSGTIEYFSAAFYLRNPVAEGLVQDSLSIARERFVGDGMQDSFVVQNQGMERVELHFHLLPGVDDGPPDLATALEGFRRFRGQLRDHPGAQYRRGLAAICPVPGVDAHLSLSVGADDHPGEPHAVIANHPQGLVCRQQLVRPFPIEPPDTLAKQAGPHECLNI